MRRLAPTLRTRLSLWLTALVACFFLLLGLFWLNGTRNGIREETEAAARVSGQWLQLLIHRQPAAEAGDAPPLLATLREAGRIRSNELELVDAAGNLLYRSPAPAYLNGRSAPAAFAALLAPEIEDRRFAVGRWSVILHADASRSIIEAWDDFRLLAAGAGALLLVLFLLARRALDRALSPLSDLLAALDQTGRGRFDLRLPVPAALELARLARAYNGMADRLAEAVDTNLRLEDDRAMVDRLHQRLDAARQELARELHDELAQGITAVRALAGAIVQRNEHGSGTRTAAEAIIETSGEMQDGVHRILQQLRSVQGEEADVVCALRDYLSTWSRRHPQIAVDVVLPAGLPALPANLCGAVLRFVQEGLTNVLRHAAAGHVAVALEARAGQLEIRVEDDGRGPAAPSSQAGSGFGLRGLGERLHAVGGVLKLAAVPGGGCRLAASLPLQTCSHGEFACLH